MKILSRVVFVFLAWSASVNAQTALEPLDHFPSSTLNIFTPDMHKHEFKIWIADTEARREQGLMFVKSLPANQGMLFIFDVPQAVSMWMKNTYIPLDMVFITADNRIESIAANTQPLSETIIASKGMVATVLELKGGEMARQGIHAGAVVQVLE